jgi:hypothetical protein
MGNCRKVMGKPSITDDATSKIGPFAPDTLTDSSLNFESKLNMNKIERCLVGSAMGALFKVPPRKCYDGMY